MKALESASPQVLLCIAEGKFDFCRVWKSLASAHTWWVARVLKQHHILSVNTVGQDLYVSCCGCTGVEGAYVAAGHSCWGILNSPATGEAMAGGYVL